MPVLMLWSLEEGTLWTESCPRLLATMATALNLLRVPVLGLLAFCRLSLSSVLRLMDRWSVQTNDTCILSQRMHCYHRENSMKESSVSKKQSQVSQIQILWRANVKVPLSCWTVQCAGTPALRISGGLIKLKLDSLN